jgi:hypothetical protein
MNVLGCLCNEQRRQPTLPDLPTPDHATMHPCIQEVRQTNTARRQGSKQGSKAASEATRQGEGGRPVLTSSSHLRLSLAHGRVAVAIAINGRSVCLC